MEDEKARLLAEARRCRRLAASINDQETAARLNALAEDYERRANTSQAGKDENE
ncbi:MULTISPECIES: hypothetical protein [Bradyrhizobium]|uniref:Uncharacterized protein n=1 Tax=Bradyrhizobium vignae TaxID=1549949 RepID=A0A2U3PU67_9BRAD|nr:hypothetical protein [Bradyrhizobium vignae]SPP92664.1 protein of unknown function [Bradyrhizobium vignae]